MKLIYQAGREINGSHTEVKTQEFSKGGSRQSSWLCTTPQPWRWEAQTPALTPLQLFLQLISDL